jgi:aarF domain-containing kinase
MLGYTLLAILLALTLLSVASQTTRRVWVFHLYLFKYLFFGLLEVVRVRRLLLAATGKRYTPLTRQRGARLLCEDMGPTFIKFGQIVASSAGMFPEKYVAEFQKCLDRVRPFAFEEVMATIHEELGPDRADQLIEIDPQPLASASIAQVHTAKLADGSEVVIKVQRPSIDHRTRADVRLMRGAAQVIAALVPGARLANPVGIVEDFAHTLREELDFRMEAQNLDQFNDIMREHGHGDIRAPVPEWDLTTRKVLVMERFFGTRVDHAEEILARGVDAEAALVKGIRAWFQCVVFHGFFHGDVHAGNLMILDNEDLGFLDFGIVGRFDDEQRRLVTDYIVAFAMGNFRRLAEVITEMGGVPPKLDFDAFAADLDEAYSPLLKLSFGELNYAEMLPRIHRVARRHNMSVPKEFVLITKQMLYFDRYAKLLAPTLNVFTDPRLVGGLMQDLQAAKLAEPKPRSPEPAGV